jgi:hypothetical protein
MGNVEYGLMTQELEARRLRRAQLRQRAVGTVHVSDLRIRQRRAEADLASGHAEGREARLLRTDRARISARIPAACALARAKSATNTFSTARRCGSPPAPSPTWPSSGPRWKTKNDKIRGFLVETDRPGFKADDIHGKWSLRASVTSGLSLQDVHIPESNLLPKKWAG